ncbi:unnamed protein product [Leptidea sinapis]|uniref:Uncharacterized protein n=1 Tax=Leptidea sinapis TaxID=189913 RepID=A0A5E4QM50_9NEOP|nr:unnamed protein product [Leptidea sinapis]
MSAYETLEIPFKDCVKKRKDAEEKDIPVESLTVGYQKNRQVFNDDQEPVVVCQVIKYSQYCYGLTLKDVKQLAFSCALKHNIGIPQSWCAKKDAGSGWLATLQRNQSSYIRTPEGASLSRAIY